MAKYSYDDSPIWGKEFNSVDEIKWRPTMSFYDAADIVIPDSVTTIKEMNRCTNITIPDSVTTIGNLSICSNITLPATLTKIGKLYSCDNYAIPKSVVSIEKLDRCSNIAISGKQLTTVGDFIGCTNVNLPESLTQIGEINGVSGISIPMKVTSVGDLVNCSDITIPKSITKLGVLRSCNDIKLPDTLTSINSMDNCSNITVPDNCALVSGMLLGTTRNVMIKAVVYNDGQPVSESITAIEGVVKGSWFIPSWVESVQEIDGENCTTIVKVDSRKPPILSKADHLGKDCILIVPEGAKSTYANHAFWSKFKTIQESAELKCETAEEAKERKDRIYREYLERKKRENSLWNRLKRLFKGK